MHAVAPVDVVEDPDAVAASVASSQPSSDAGQRAVLDRLLEEAEALRGADEVAHDAVSDLCDAACELGAAGAGHGSSEATSGRREASSLRDRAAAARNAFNRADALVAMAQGYLRGDRPQRAPIEVVLTIPASSLHAGATLDPVEVGEMGESFLSGETARRLSCDAGVERRSRTGIGAMPRVRDALEEFDHRRAAAGQRRELLEPDQDVDPGGAPVAVVARESRAGHFGKRMADLVTQRIGTAMVDEQVGDLDQRRQTQRQRQRADELGPARPHPDRAREELDERASPPRAVHQGLVDQLRERHPVVDDERGRMPE